MSAQEKQRIRFIFPSDVIESKKPDEVFLDQIKAFQEAGFPISIISLEYLQMGETKIHPPLERDETIIYRGWMMDGDDYRKFCEAVSATGAHTLIDGETYLLCHHLPNWYTQIAEFTPETVTFARDADLKAGLKVLNWDAYFIKDYVKSLTTDAGSMLRSIENVDQLVSDMIRFRGEIEGGFCVRRVEDLQPDSEIRYFVIHGTPFANDALSSIPEVVREASTRIRSSFFSVDVIKRADGVDRIMEIGDGQVSDVVGWTPARLAEVWRLSAQRVDQPLSKDSGDGDNDE